MFGGWLRQGTAVSIKMGPFVDATDGHTAETAVAIPQSAVRLAKNDGAWAQKSASGGATHEENGWYEVALDATDTGTLGILVVAIGVAGTRPVYRTFMVVEPSIYDAWLGGGGPQPVNVVAWGDNNVAASATPGVPVVDLGYWLGVAPLALQAQRVQVFVGALAGNVIAAAGLAADAANEIASAVWNAARASHTTIGTFGEGVASVQGDVAGSVQGDVQGSVGSVSGNVGGNLGGNLLGSVVGDVQGSLLGSVVGDVQGNVQGSLNGNVGGDLNGNVQGNVQGSVNSVAGDVQGNLVGNVQGDVQGNVDGSVGSVSAIAAGAINAAAIASAAANKLADHVWRRTLANVAASANGDAVSSRSPLSGMRKLVNRVRLTGGVLSWFEEDDTTVAGTQTATQNASSTPITELDPP